jgi:hypothetical protein
VETYLMWFWFAFPLWPGMLRIVHVLFWPFVLNLSKNFYSFHLPILGSPIPWEFNILSSHFSLHFYFPIFLLLLTIPPTLFLSLFID